MTLQTFEKANSIVQEIELTRAQIEALDESVECVVSIRILNQNRTFDVFEWGIDPEIETDETNLANEFVSKMLAAKKNKLDALQHEFSKL